MSSQPAQPAKHYAKLICHYMKTLPDKYADDPKDVQEALALSDAEFKSGLDWCVARKLITLDKAVKSGTAPLSPTPAASSTTKSPFMMDDDDDDGFVSNRELVFGTEAVAG
jgi:hypothetical protein